MWLLPVRALLVESPLVVVLVAAVLLANWSEPGSAQVPVEAADSPVLKPLLGESSL